MDGPSRDLCERLAAWNLCAPRDLADCRRFVRRLTRDLPAFDSVWIDALVRAHRLTPFQGKVLDSADPQRLCVGPFVLSECLEEDAWRGVYRGCRLDEHEVCLLTIQRPHAGDLQRVAARLDELAALSKTWPHEVLAGPTAVHREPDRLVAISRDVDGPSLKELLVRRGRFPADAVASIAKGLAAALDRLSRSGAVHGDLRLKNVRLNARGELRLLHGGWIPALAPDFGTGASLPLDVYDGLAPEIGEGRPPDGRSDQYALGCLLWQLLAGRPPFPTGDPLAKLACHATRRIPDVREYAPQTPASLADVIRRATTSDAACRAASFDELLHPLGGFRAADRRRLKEFASSFQGEAPRQVAERPSALQRARPAAGVLTGLAALAVWLSHSGVDMELLRIGRDPVVDAAQPSGSTPASASSNPASTAGRQTEPPTAGQAVRTSPEKSSELADMPDPQADGAVWLVPERRYRPRTFEVRGPLSIRSTDGSLARVVVGDAGWSVAADSIHIEHLEILSAPGAVPSAGHVLEAHCRTLAMRMCRIQGTTSNGDGQAAPCNIEWRPAEASTAAASSVELEDCCLLDAGLSCSARPSVVKFTNCLKTGPPPLCRLSAAGRAHHAVRVEAMRTTLRQSGPLVSWKPGSPAAGLRIDAVAYASVFELAGSCCLLEIDAPAPPPDWERLVAISGMESIVPPETRLIGLSSSGADSSARLDPTRLNAEGLLYGAVQFRGPDPHTARDSALAETDAVRSAAALPGITADSLPADSARPLRRHNAATAAEAKALPTATAAGRL